ncbi:MAG: hypothetical protein HY898_04935 [Deltaproteobacteria bacterium]|nr:hypothetical protein [Deltaproteobacteria bacterium]
MNLRDRSIALTALFLGAAWGASHGCTVGGAGTPTAIAAEDADPGVDAGVGGGSGTTCNCNCAQPGPRQLKSYGEMMDALLAGIRVRAVLHYAKCDLGGSPGPDAVGGMDIGTYEQFAAGVVGNPSAYLATSETKLIQMQSGKVYNYVKLKISEDGSVTISAQYLDPTTFAVKMDETFTCKIDDGSKTAGVALFATGG